MSAVLSADRLVEELEQSPTPRPGEPRRVSYSHDAMIDLIIANPWMDQNRLAAHFGYTAGWVSRIIGSDAFQAKLAARREEVVDPAIKATIEERFRGLVVLSLQRLQEELEKPQVNANVALRAAELGAKALGLGGHAPPPVAPPADRLAALAERLVQLQSNVRDRKGITYEVQSLEVLPRAEGGEVSLAGERLGGGAETAHSGGSDADAI